MDANCERCDDEDCQLFFCVKCERYLCDGCFGDVAGQVCDECLDEMEEEDGRE
jgi:hypothetical protein